MQGNMHSLLSKPQILRHYEQGNIIIHPFDEKNVNTVSVDVRLGEHYFRPRRQEVNLSVFNPFDQTVTNSYWGEPLHAVFAKDWMERHGRLENISENDRLIIVHPGETILAHTIEFIGGRNCVTSAMRAKSSMGRIGISVVKCAGWGDVGYYNRWTMQITNHLAIPTALVVGMRIAQMVFYEVDPIEHDDSYSAGKGAYQREADIKQMVREWSPSMMLPQLYRDRDIGRFHTFLDGHAQQ